MNQQVPSVPLNHPYILALEALYNAERQIATLQRKLPALVDQVGEGLEQLKADYKQAQEQQQAQQQAELVRQQAETAAAPMAAVPLPAIAE